VTSPVERAGAVLHAVEAPEPFIAAGVAAGLVDRTDADCAAVDLIDRFKVPSNTVTLTPGDFDHAKSTSVPVLGQLAPRGIDGRLHILRGAINAAAKVEVHLNRGLAE
jgi:hypothetical protein